MAVFQYDCLQGLGGVSEVIHQPDHLCFSASVLCTAATSRLLASSCSSNRLCA